jgi:hypothetical protein
MALITTFRRATAGEPQRVRGEVECGYSTFERQGRRSIQLDTYGSPDRRLPGKVSQTNNSG